MLQEEHKQFEDLLSFMADVDANLPSNSDEDPRDTEQVEGYEKELIKFESLAALQAHAPDLISNAAMGDKNVTMYKDAKCSEMWVVAISDNHILSKGA